MLQFRTQYNEKLHYLYRSPCTEIKAVNIGWKRNLNWTTEENCAGQTSWKATS